ncbi:MAG: ribonuclease HI [Desulfobacteraceae bacterium]|nr:ribonuclease HI [Desulfobacteraceae bacterium]
MEKKQTDWKRMLFKGNKVWLATNQNGKPILKSGKVLIKYQLDQDYEYWVHEKGVMPVNSLQSEKPEKPEKKELKKNRPRKKSPARLDAKTERKTEFDTKTVSDNTIFIYTDGASSGNPGPSGIGVLLRFKDHEKEISRNIGEATNNIAELEAIKTALLELKHYDYPVRLFTDSSYACGVLTLGWKARKNSELINSIKKLISKFSDLKLIKVKGHDGFDGNEKADFLATSAIKRERNKEKI